MTVPVTDRKRPTSLDLGITSLVISGHSGKPEQMRGFTHIEEQDLSVQHGAELLAAGTKLNSTVQFYFYSSFYTQNCLQVRQKPRA